MDYLLSWEFWQPYMPVIIEWLLIPGLLAIGAWLWQFLPGPLRNFLQSRVHKADMEVFLGTMMRKGMALQGTGLPARAMVAAMIQYAFTTRPDLAEKLQPSQESLDTFGAAILKEIEARTATVLPGSK